MGISARRDFIDYRDKAIAARVQFKYDISCKYRNCVHVAEIVIVKAKYRALKPKTDWQTVITDFRY